MVEYNIFDEHIVHYLDDQGEELEVVMVFEFGPDMDVDLGEGDVLVRRTGRARFVLNDEEYAVTASGEGPVQLVHRLMTLCGSLLLQTAQALELNLYQHETGDVGEPLDLFK